VRQPDAIVNTTLNALVVSRYEGDGQDWDDFVRSQPGWTHFHLFGWSRVIRRVFRHECVYLVARDPRTNALAGVLPLVRVKSLIFGHYLVSMPFLNYGGPLGTDDAVRALAAEASRLAQEAGVKLLELRSRRELPLDWHASHRKLTVLLDLPPNPDDLWKALPSKLRSQVKRPKKEGIVVKFGADQIDAFYGVFAHHMRDLGTPAQSKRLFQVIAEEFGDEVHFAVAYHQEQPVACGCGFLWGTEFEITWASALRSHKAMSPNMLVYWELMERVTRAGATVFNFGRCSPDSGTHRFKMQWGSREEQLWWYQPKAASGAEESATPSPDKGVFALATRVWQRLPVSVATSLGSSIVRGIP
jgi:FemAB-related protein (PEP-CTERM system-associated)